jgi:hypothetical protein
MSDAYAVVPTAYSGHDGTASSQPPAVEESERVGRGLLSSRRFARALTAAPLRPARAVRFARMVRDEPFGD